MVPLSLEKIMSNCTGLNDLTEHEAASLELSAMELSKKIKLKGELTESDMDKLSVPKNVEDSHQCSKDELVNYRRRCIMLTHPAYIEKESQKHALIGWQQAEKEKRKQLRAQKQQEVAANPPEANGTKRKRKSKKSDDFVYENDEMNSET